MWLLSRFRRIFMCMIAVSLSACAIGHPPPIPMQTKFRSEDHQAYLQPGTNTIQGQGFLRQQGGNVVTCAGEAVFVVPATPFFREIVAHFRAGNDPQLNQGPDPDAAQAIAQVLKQSQCDAQGNFVFHDLPTGNWLIATQVQWKIGYGIPQGGSLVREVVLGSTLVTQVLLSDKDFIGR